MLALPMHKERNSIRLPQYIRERLSASNHSQSSACLFSDNVCNGLEDNSVTDRQDSHWAERQSWFGHVPDFWV